MQKAWSLANYSYLFATGYSTHTVLGMENCDYCDGEQYINHPLFTEDPCALQIEICYDDIKTVNALGSKTKLHKLGKLN